TDLRSAELTSDERALVERIAARRDDIVALACELIGFDTTSRAHPAMPARQERGLQTALAERLRAAGADVDLWEPAPGDVANHPLSGGRTFTFEGRPQLAARLRGSGGGGVGLFNGPNQRVSRALAAWWG